MAVGRESALCDGSPSGLPPSSADEPKEFRETARLVDDPPATDTPTHQELRFLVAKDNVINEKSGAAILPKGRYIDLFASGDKAFEAVQSNRYDVELMGPHRR